MSGLQGAVPAMPSAVTSRSSSRWTRGTTAAQMQEGKKCCASCIWWDWRCSTRSSSPDTHRRAARGQQAGQHGDNRQVNMGATGRSASQSDYRYHCTTVPLYHCLRHAAYAIHLCLQITQNYRHMEHVGRAL